MDRDSSSDDDDDRQTLIHQNDTKPHDHHPPSTFHIQHLHSPPSSRSPSPPRPKPLLLFFKNLNKTYLSLLFLPLLILLLFLFSPHLRLNVPSIRFDSLTDQMRESELRALSLLKQQHSLLLSLFNHSLSNTSSSSAPTPTLPLLTLNNQIQQALLSPHTLSNSNSSHYDHLLPPYLCPKNKEPDSNRPTVQWNPKPDKFLFAICLSGQMSNHLICLEKHMFFAALMGRVLVIPSYKVDYQYSRVLDIDHINACLGRKVVVSFEDFAETRKNRVHIDRFLCYFSSPQPCYVDDEHIKKLKQQLGVSVGKIETVWKEDIKKPSRKTVQDVEAKFKTDDDVIAIGDVFFANVEQEWTVQPGGPIAHKCKTLIEPSRLIMLTAQRFVQTFLGNNFVALHFRRHGFLKFCNAKKPSCFYPIPQAAECITQVIERTNAPVIYLSTDAAESETSLLQSLLVLNGKTVPLVKRPPRNSAEKWDALLYRHHLEDDSQVEAMLDKTICAMSNVFIGASGSTFTEDILRLRKDWRSASVCDEYLCQGEEPNFIAEDE